MGVVFQDFRLLKDRNVYDNVAFAQRIVEASPRQMRKNVPAILGKVGLAGKYRARTDELSGGEQQRIAIARAILNSPKLIIADEPTANLDPDTAKGIMELLYGFSKQQTAVVMSTHNLQLLEQFPGVVYHCENNQIIKE
jgi:cell division transport system ATP-binding protein